MNRTESIEFELEMFEKEPEETNKLFEENYTDNQYQQANFHADNTGTADLIMNLQKVLKSEYLTLSHQEKRKLESIKQLEYSCRNMIERMIHSRNLLEEEKQQKILLTDKDLQDLHPNLYSDLKKFGNQLQQLDSLANLFVQSSQEPPECFIEDFNNFFPNFTRHLEEFIKLQINNSIRIQNVFESQYTITGRILKNLYKRYQFEIFSQKLLQRGLAKMCVLKTELIISFQQQYERIKELLEESVTLKYYIHGQQESIEQNYKEIETILGIEDTSQDICISILESIKSTEADLNTYNLMMNQFQTRLHCSKEFISFRLGMLTHRSINIKRQLIEEIVTLFMQDFLGALAAFPLQIRFMVHAYEKYTAERFKQNMDIKIFFVKAVFSKWLSTDLMRYYINRSSKAIGFQEKNTNFSVICLVLQKILLGQPFHENESNACFNSLINYFKESIDQFLVRFKNIDNQILLNTSKLNLIVLSFQTVRYLIMRLNQKQKQYPQFVQFLQLQSVFNRNVYQIGNDKYSTHQLYIILVDIKSQGFTKIFNTPEKIKRILIHFLLAINQIHQPIPLLTLLERHKYAPEIRKNSKIPTELYANYLLTALKNDIKIKQLSQSILQEIRCIKEEQKRIRVLLQQSRNYSENLEKIFTEMCTKKKKVKAMIEVEKLWQNIKLRFRMIVKPGEFIKFETTKESEFKRNDKSIIIYESDTIRQFLKQISSIFAKEEWDIENSTIKVNEIYNAYVEELIDVIISSQPKIQEALVEKIKEKMGIFLFSFLRINTTVKPSNQNYVICLKKLQNIGLKDLQPKYEEQEDLFYESVREIVQSFNEAASPEGILQKFNQILMTIQQIILTTGKASQITADIQIPLMQMILTRSKLETTKNLLCFIQGFMINDTHMTILGQVLTVLKSAVYLIEQLNGLKIEEIENQKIQKKKNQY